jgi:hypothetical protein
MEKHLPQLLQTLGTGVGVERCNILVALYSLQHLNVRHCCSKPEKPTGEEGEGETTKEKREKQNISLLSH